MMEKVALGHCFDRGDMVESFRAFRKGWISGVPLAPGVVASAVTAGLLVAVASLGATSSPRQVTTKAAAAASPQRLRIAPAPDSQSAILADAPGTTVPSISGV